MRRQWHEALPGKSKKSPDKTPAEIGFDYCNQLFKLEKAYADLDAATQASSIIYSLVETAKLNNLNIYAYLETVLLYMPDYKNEPAGIEQLMPWSGFVQERYSGIIDDNLELPEKRENLPI